MRTALFLVLFATHGCEPAAAPLLISPEHRADIERHSFVPVARIGDLPDAVQGALGLLPGNSATLANPATVPIPQHGVILLGCSVDHCIVHYEHRGIFYIVLLGMASRVLVEWESLFPEPLGSLAEAKAVILQPSAHARSRRWW